MIVQGFTPALISPLEHLRRERQAPTRHECVGGGVCEMAGAARNHFEIQAALAIELGPPLKGEPCRLLGQDTKLFVASTNAYYYPDATVSCPPSFIDDASGVIDNPTVVIEVLSPSTRILDRGAKFADYRTLPSLRDYVLIDSERRKVEVFSLEKEAWTVRVYEGDVAWIPSLELGISLDELYRHVVLT